MSRLATDVIAGGLMRRAEAEGCFAAVIARGDPLAGALIVLVASRGGEVRALERVLGGDDRYRWQETRGAANASELTQFLEKRRRSDPDLWIIELDVPSIERFVAEMNSID